MKPTHGILAFGKISWRTTIPDERLSPTQTPYLYGFVRTRFVISLLAGQ